MTRPSIAVGTVSWEDRSTNPPARGNLLILPNETVLIGRDESRNDVTFADPAVSRCQLEFFSIVVDEEYKHPPLVFVRDRGSSNGTCLNGQLIGKGVKLSAARLLENGDKITIGSFPHLTLVYTQLLLLQSSYTLSHLQRQEVKIFKDRFIVTDRTIGNGGHAVVFLAKDVESGQDVVCKVHDISRFSRKSQNLRRIRQEATLLSTLDHPNVLPMKAAFETQQTIYMITELATGGDLYSLLLRYNRLEERGIRCIIWQVLRGLAYVHDKGVVHRDIKPENILCGITPQGPYRVMLSDFGDAAISGRGRMKSNVGTPFYRPPECQSLGREHDSSVDIWAVGVLTLQLFLGHEQFPGFDSMVFSSQEEVDRYVSSIFALLSRRGVISEAGKSFIRECLAYASQKRPTARRACQHDWLQEPKADKRMLKMLEANNFLSWEPQRAKFPVIEDLMAESSKENKRESAADEERDALQNTVSPHFMASREAWTDMGPSRPGELLHDSTAPAEGNLEPLPIKRQGILAGRGSAKRVMVSLFKSH